MKILFETKFGSHVYGTNTPLSDLDFKGIYQAEYRDIILNKAKDSIVTTTKKNKVSIPSHQVILYDIISSWLRKQSFIIF